MRENEVPSECDIVMKGGITSGVVYPAAIVALSAKYRFRNIGGTSAGAIAAAVTAAAEYCRQSGNADAFKALSALPGWLASDGHLLKLFRPNRRTRAAFNFLMRVLDSPKGQSKLRAVFGALPLSYPGIAIPGALLGLVIMAIGIVSHRWWMVPIGVFLATMLPFALPGWLLYRCIADDVPRNFYGLCTGLDGNLNDPAVLTSWLANLIDEVSGVNDGPKPLTFGDLWRAGAAEFSPAAKPASDAHISADAADAERNARSINLEMITTNVTHGRPYKFPFDTNIFYFHPEEFGKLFPPRVVKWMLQHARHPKGEEESARMRSALPLVPLPQAQDIPIVVAARMSLSFPLLISAVPLWAVDWTLRYNRDHRTAPKFERCWFSDGGLSSNFPVHLFDSPIPSRPTFGIDLDSFTPDYPENEHDESANVWMPETNRAGIDERWMRFDETRPNLGGFFGAIFCAMQNWQDNMQSRVPGFRDRIAHVNLSAEEGGLNLNMKPEILNKLAKRGFYAGQLLIRHFQAPDPETCGPDRHQPMNWDNHRVARYRNAMSLLENWVRRFSRHFTPQYSALVDRPLDAPPCSYPWQDENQRAFAQGATKELVDLDARWESSGESFAPGAPRPQPDLATRPRV